MSGPEVGGQAARRTVAGRAQFLRGLHLSGGAGNHAGADDAGAAADVVDLLLEQPCVLAAGLAGRLCAGPLRVRRAEAAAGAAGLVAAPAGTGTAVWCGRGAASVEGILAAGRGGLRADPHEG